MELRPLRFQSRPMVPDAERVRHVLSNTALDVPWLDEAEYHGRRLAIVGGGPSLRDTWHEIPKDADVWALNGAYDFLVERGIVPGGHIILDARRENITFIRHPRDCTTWYLASQVHPSLFAALRDYRVVLWHTGDEEDRIEEFQKTGKPLVLIYAGATVGLKALGVADTLGYRDLHLFGYDSSHRRADGHAYDQPLNADDEVINVSVGDRTYQASAAMARQAEHFMEHAQELSRRGASITIYGDGLLPYMATLLGTDPTTTRHHRAEVIEDLVCKAHLTEGHGVEINAGDAGVSRWLLDACPGLRMTVTGVSPRGLQGLGHYDGRAWLAEDHEAIGSCDFVFANPGGGDDPLGWIEPVLSLIRPGGFVAGHGLDRPEVRKAVAKRFPGCHEVTGVWWEPIGQADEIAAA